MTISSEFYDNGIIKRNWEPWQTTRQKIYINKENCIFPLFVLDLLSVNYYN